MTRPKSARQGLTAVQLQAEKEARAVLDRLTAIRDASPDPMDVWALETAKVAVATMLEHILSTRGGVQ